MALLPCRPPPPAITCDRLSKHRRKRTSHTPGPTLQAIRAHHAAYHRVIWSSYRANLAICLLGASLFVSTAMYQFPHPYTSHASRQCWSKSTSIPLLIILPMKWVSIRCNGTLNCGKNLPCFYQCCLSADRRLSLVQLADPKHRRHILRPRVPIQESKVMINDAHSP